MSEIEPTAPRPKHAFLSVCTATLVVGLCATTMAAPEKMVGDEDQKPHWSMTRLTKPEVPDDAMHPIDSFIRSRLPEKNLHPAAQADRRTLIRRLSYDLTGLPPTPENAEAFESDPDPKAYEALVDRLLGSPRYGEHWARHCSMWQITPTPMAMTMITNAPTRGPIETTSSVRSTTTNRTHDSLRNRWQAMHFSPKILAQL